MNTPTNMEKVSSSIPTLGEAFSSSTTTATRPISLAQAPSSQQTGGRLEETDPKTKNRISRLGDKKEQDNVNSDNATNYTTVTPRSTSPFSSGLRSGSPQAQGTMASFPSSPSRQIHSSPRLHSPAESQIFERNVQEDSSAVVTSPAIPSHIATEDHIPPVLDASSMAITDDHLTPDTVEIVTHAAHLPAAAAVSGSIHAESTLSSPVVEENGQFLDGIDDQTPSYAALDSADIRRLSFISFADVVHGEQATEGSLRDSFYLSGSNSISPSGARSPSPIRSPILQPSSYITGTGDNSKGLGLESISNRKGGPCSPKAMAASLATSSSPTVTGEIAIETMRQALRKTGSGDLGAAARSSISAL